MEVSALRERSRAVRRRRRRRRAVTVCGLGPVGQCERGSSLGRVRGALSAAGVGEGAGCGRGLDAGRRAPGGRQVLVLPRCCWAALSLRLPRSR